MKAAPGAQLDVKDIFGRDEFVKELWKILENNSLRLEAERRIGKTSILKKMEKQVPDGWEAVYMDVESVTTAEEFAEKVCEEIFKRLSGWKKQGKRLGELFKLMGGMEVGGITFPEERARPAGYWKRLLTDSIQDLIEQQAAADRKVVFFFDEMPWMLTKISENKDNGPKTAMDLLDAMRALRQASEKGKGFRMVICGSIGMHHLLRKLEDAGYQNRPVNDVHPMEVQPLDGTAAIEFAALLLAGEGLACEQDVPRKIAEETGGFHYYTHWIVSRVRMGGRPKTVSHEDVKTAMKFLLTDPSDPCDFRHFKKRINQHYPAQKGVVIGLIDHVAESEKPVSRTELVNVGKSKGAKDDEQVRDLLQLLAMDHYFAIDDDGKYSFRHALLRRWWKIEQGLN